MNDFLDQLNENQRAAVLYNDGPSLVIAGAGSGKTRVLTYKIAWLLLQGMPAYTILALTFTNKAAREMKNRIAALTDEQTARRLWMGTFHSICYRILRKEAASIGFPSDFTIYDSADSKNLIKKIIKDMKLDDKIYRPGMSQNRISNAKNALISDKSYESNKELIEYDIKCRMPLLSTIYKHYQNRCFQSGAMDFDDLLLYTNILFRDHPDVLSKYKNFFRYVLVDEYQDTNFAQHLIVQRLCEAHQHICAVGDDAQSIYSFRGANIDNILKFKNNYPGCRIFKLERNYRSTQNIVNAANSLIGKNKEQIPKNIYSEKEKGSKIAVYSSYSDFEEGYIVATKVLEMKREQKESGYSDFAVLYRTNAQSRIIEEAFRKRNIPYKIYGGLSFYQRKEIKDVISYFRVLVNPNDEEALRRIINYPARGIGDKTVQKIADVAFDRGTSFWNVLSEPLTYSLDVNNGTLNKLQAFRQLIGRLIEENKRLSADEIAVLIIKECGLMTALYEDRSVEGVSKQENVEELLKGITEFCELRREEAGDDSRISLSDFLAEVSLLTDQDNDKDEHSEKATLMTVHAAKGLEFKNVFIVGMEEDLFPSSMAKDSYRAIEEERRLFYVAITRAEKNCVLTYAKSRFRNGQSTICSPSRFLKDIDPEYLDLSDEIQAQWNRNTVLRSERTAFEDNHKPMFRSPLRQEPEKRVVRPLSRLEKAIHSPTAPNIEIPDIKPGMRIRHARFGEGVVIAMEGADGNVKATINFDNFGQKQLLLKFAKLQIVG